MKKDNNCQSCRKDLGEEYSYSWDNFIKLCESCYCVVFWGSVRQPVEFKSAEIDISQIRETTRY